MTGHSTATADARKRLRNQITRKLPPNYPLYAHLAGYLSRRVGEKTLHFGRWGRMVAGQIVPVDDLKTAFDQALAAHDQKFDSLKSGKGDGRTVQVNGELPKAAADTFESICDRFLNAKQKKLDAGRIGARMLQDYVDCFKFVGGHLGLNTRIDDLRPLDFENLHHAMATKWGPVRLANSVIRVRSVFKFALANELISKLPQYGSEFVVPSRSELRKYRNGNGKTKLFGRDEIHKLLKTAKNDTTMTAVILLGVNAAYGNTDVAELRLDHLDLETGFADFARPKTGISRRAALWSQTVLALKKVLAERPAAKEAADRDLVFLQQSGQRWIRLTANSRTDVIGKRFSRLMEAAKIPANGRAIYGLRHTFRTVADEARDSNALDLVMGHASDNSMGGRYTHGISDDRLQAVSQIVHSWLFGSPKKGETTHE
jgi:integrase